MTGVEQSKNKNEKEYPNFHVVKIWICLTI